MPAIAFLSTDNLEDFFVYDELLIPFFEKRGWSVETVSWHSTSTNWDKFNYVIVRSTWDYQQHAGDFLACLKGIDTSSAVLLNPLPLMQWNIEKHYLKDLQGKGVPIVETMWGSEFNNNVIEEAFAQFGCDTVVIKPTLSANADDTFKLSAADWHVQEKALYNTFQRRDFMIQPFLSSVVDEGEYSLFYFGGEFSHAIKKVPQKGDFRVQEEHGGSLHSIAVDSEQLAIAEKALAAMPCDALYARVDLVKQNNHWAIMELELIEPSLYFNLDPQSPLRFVEALVRYHELAQ
jgi:glutathione synthase/RimK-type ligase-like ATP-grasp enzyme|tara:strand:+ start:1274 stop:2146 length:873 start_codon:yes stop_codon:yes gene_type:complete